MKKKSIVLSTTIVSWIRRLSLLVLFAGCLTYPNRVQAKPEAKILSTTVNEDQVKIRILVTNKQDLPATNLREEEFEVIVDKVKVEKLENWRNLRENQRRDAWFIFLLDMSGSMKHRDKRNQVKLDGAIQAIQEFIDATDDLIKTTDNQGINAQVNVSIVPFGEAGDGCEDGGYKVDNNKLDDFFDVGMEKSKLESELKNLKKVEIEELCAATNIYDPLTKAIRFFSEERGDPRFYPDKKTGQPSPRLSIILLSDGYHSTPNNEQQEKREFDELLSVIKRNRNIVVHSLGYGLKPKELADKYRKENEFYKEEATRDDLFYTRNGKVDLPPDKVPADEFLDRDRLDEIARKTGGICKISGNAQAVGNALIVFLDALLGGYEITYTDPNPIRAERHEVQVKVDSRHVSTELSEPKPYRITSFGWPLPSWIRLTMFVGVFLAMGIGGAVPFYFWGKYLKREALED
jgi:hypothetical protein